jgi:predicted NodU family carbamoyl transferase
MTSKKDGNTNQDQYQQEVKKQKSIEQKLMNEANQFRKEFAGRLLTLLTSGFGLVAALAWNELIRETVNVYIKPYFGEEGGLISLALYAILVTFLAVLVTYNLSRFADKAGSK